MNDIDAWGCAGLMCVATACIIAVIVTLSMMLR